MKILHECMRDLTSLGSFWFNAILIAFFFLLGKYDITLQLSIATIILVNGLAIVIRLLYYKERPDKEKYTNLIEKIEVSSFPSIHAARVFCIAYLLMPFFANTFVTLFLFSLAALISYTRIYLKRHYWSDVIAGAVIGILIGILTVYLFSF